MWKWLEDIMFVPEVKKPEYKEIEPHVLDQYGEKDVNTDFYRPVSVSGNGTVTGR